MSGFPRGGSGGSGGGVTTITSTGGFLTATGTTTVDLEANSTAANQVFNSTGAGTGAWTANPQVSSLGVGTPALSAGFAAFPVNGGIQSSNITNGALVIKSIAGAAGIQFVVNNTFLAGSWSGANAALVINAGTNTATAATVTTPTLSAAAVVNTGYDVMVYIVVGTAGTLTIAIGPTSGVANTIVAGLAVPLGAMYSIRLPAGWFIAVTTTTTAAWTTTAIVC